jgi:SAM-dependent methyltransferase
LPAPAEPPYPPLRLADRVLSLAGYADPLAAYRDLGLQTKAALLELLPPDWSFAGKRVLDFGCGAGRTLRHLLADAEDAEVWGADIDADSIAWLQRELCPPLHAARCRPEPPLEFEDGSFDLAWAISVFTHLTDTSLPWLLELHRVLRPGGLLIATYMGRWNSEVLAHEPWDEDRIGMNVLRHDNAWDAGGPMVLMSDWWVREHWGRAFEILEIAPQVHNQSWALLRRRDVRLTVADLEQPSDDPREYRALRHNVRQAQRELELAVGRLTRAYEHSLSWRLARPLRAARRRLAAIRRRSR